MKYLTYADLHKSDERMLLPSSQASCLDGLHDHSLDYCFRTASVSASKKGNVYWNSALQTAIKFLYVCGMLCLH